MAKYLKNIIAGIGVIALYAGLTGCTGASTAQKRLIPDVAYTDASLQPDVMSTSEKIEYLTTFQRNFLQSRGKDIEKEETLSLTVILKRTGQEGIGRVTEDDIQKRGRKRSSLTKYGFVGSVHYCMTREDGGKNRKMHIQYQPAKDTRIAFSDNILCEKPNKCSDHGFEMPAPDSSNAFGERAAFDKLKDDSFDPIIKSATHYITAEGYGKVLSYEKGFSISDSRDITQKDIDYINKEYNKVLDIMIDVLKQRYGDKYNQP